MSRSHMGASKGGMMGIGLFSLAQFAFVSISLISRVGLEITAQTQTIEAPITKVYTPIGFDDNDVAQFVIEGEFRDTCFSLGPVRLRTDLDNSVIYFYVEAYRAEKQCLPVKTPFTRVVDVGILPAGSYHIVPIRKLNQPAALLKITDAPSSSIDNFHYAPVDAVFLHNNEDGQRKLMTLSGNFTNSCMKFGEDPIPVKRVARDIVIVLPIVEFNKADACLDVMVPFFRTVELPEEVTSGKYLFHIRTQNGNSLNKVDFVKLH